VRARFFLGFTVFLLAASASIARAQDEQERPGESRGGYAWGEENARAQLPEDPLRIMAFAGAGIGFRIVRNLDFNQSYDTPGYLDLGAALFLPGGELRHGAGVALTSNLTGDTAVGPFEQWLITPSYHLLVPLRRVIDGMDQDWLHLQARLGVPLVFTMREGDEGGVDFSVGGELALALNFKFLAGLGLYVEIQAALYGGSNSTVHPVVSADGGFFIDYEVLP
jgi:hypothetical protein